MTSKIDDQEQVEAALQLREQQYRDIFELTSDAIFVFDYSGRLMEVNPAACAMHGYSHEEFIGMHGKRFLHSDAHLKFEDFLRRTKTGERYYVEGMHVHKDGRLISVKVTGTSFMFAGRPALLAVAQDVSEERKTVDALREREQYLQAIVQNTPECIKVVAADGTLLQINPAGLRMTEASPAADVTGCNVYELIAPEHRQMYRDFNEKICQGESGILQYDIIGLRGSRLQMETHAVPLRNPDGTVAQLALTRDITERKRTEETLRESEERFRATFHQTAIGMAQTDLNGRHVLVNEHYCRITGYSREELLEQTFLDITHPDDRERNREKFRRLLSEESPTYELDKRYIRKEGGVIWGHVTVSSVLGAGGKPQYIIAAVQDISEQKRKEEALQFLVDLNAAIQPLAEPGEIMDVTSRMLGEYLGVDRCAYAEVNAGEENYTVIGHYSRDGSGLVGQSNIHAFGAEALRLMYANISFVSDDVEADIRIDAQALPVFRQKNIRAAICVPLHKAGRLVAGVAVHQQAPRFWLPEEVELVELVAGRCWESIERARAIRILRENERRLTAEAAAMTRLHELVSRLLVCTNLNTALNEVLDAAIALMSADMGNIRLLNPHQNMLEIAVHRGFEQDFLEYFSEVNVNEGSFSWALKCRERVIVEDVQADPRFEPHLQIAESAGFRAVQSMPLIGRNGELLGLLSTHHRNPYRPDEHNLRILDLYGRQAADFIERMRAQEALRDNERRQRFIMDSMPQKIFTARIKGDDNYLNPQWMEFTGLSYEQIVGWGWTHFIHPDDVEENIRLWRHSVETGEPFQVEHRFRRADGEYRWHMSRALPMRDAEGRIALWVGSSTDIHDLKVAKEELVRLTAESERQRRLYETIHDSTPDLVYVFDLDHRFSYANRALLTMWGRTLDQALGKNCLELGYPDWHAAMHDRELEQVKATKQPVRGEVPFMSTHGHRIYDYIFVPVLGANGDVEAIAGTTRDVTERKQAEEATQRRSEQLRRLAEVATRLNTAHDVASVLNVVTGEARNLIGTHQAITSFIVGENWEQAVNTISLSDRYGQWRHYDAKPDGSGIYSLVCRLNKPMRMTQAELETHPAWKGFGAEAGKHPPMRGWLAAPLVGRDGRNIGLMQLSDKYEGEFTEDDQAILVQMAQMASVAVENARLVEDLRDASRRKDEFLATLAHELRNPLAPLRNMLEIMKRTEGNGESLEQARDMMERQLVHMVRLVDDLLDVSRVSRGKLELRCERLELATVVNQAVEACNGLIVCAGHKLDIALPPEPIHLHADPVRLVQIIDNLLNNACKYTEPGGRIWLTAERRDGEVEVKVRDTGIGIPADKLSGIFEMFAQIDHSLERLQGGLGIGLTLVKQLVEMHDGTVTAHSDGPGRGSEFTVRLPVLEEKPRPKKQSRPAAKASRARPRRILVVDDNQDSANSLAMLLKMSGHETQVAYDGLQAVEVAERFRPDLLLLDIGLPKLNGYDACRRIRSQVWGKGIMIVAVSGWGQEQDRLRSQEAGFDQHVVKPVDLAALNRLLV